MPKARYALIVAGWCAIAAACGGRTPITPTPPPTDPPPVDQPPPAPPPPTPVLGITRILAFGDSMTAGTTQPAYTFRLLDAGPAVGYPYKLETLLTAEYASQSIVTLNAGIAGRHATQDRSRLSGDISEAQPEVLLLMEGANDLNDAYGLTGDALTMAIDAAAAAVEDMVRDARSRGVRVMLATLPPQRPGGSRAHGVDFLGRYNDAMRQIATKKDAILVDVNARFPLELIGQDGLHPTEQGYDKLAEIFRDVIVSTYDATPATVSR